MAHLHESVHVGLEAVQVGADGEKVQVVDDHEVSAGGGDDQLVGLRRQLHAHQTAHVEDAVEGSRLGFGIRVDVPSVDRTVETRSHEQAWERGWGKWRGEERVEEKVEGEVEENDLGSLRAVCLLVLLPYRL